MRMDREIHYRGKRSNGGYVIEIDQQRFEIIANTVTAAIQRALEAFER